MECLDPRVGVPCYKWSEKQHCKVFAYKILKSAKNFFSQLDCSARSAQDYLNDYPDFYDLEGNLKKPLLIRCGQCINCRLEQSRQWAMRMSLEKIEYRSDQCWFVTLTYSDDNLHVVKGDLATCRMDDISEFMKRLRAYFAEKYGLDGVRFYAATEYGDQTFRPHGHMILYGCPVPDVKVSPIDSNYYQSELLEKLWQHGNVVLAEVSFEDCAYTARYVTKKITGKRYEEEYKPYGIEQEKSRMSRMPGIGMFYFDPEIYGQVEKAVGPGRIFKRCAAFDRKMKDLNPVIYEELKKEAQKVVDLRLKAEPVTRSFAQRLDVLADYAASQKKYKGNF